MVLPRLKMHTMHNKEIYKIPVTKRKEQVIVQFAGFTEQIYGVIDKINGTRPNFIYTFLYKFRNFAAN